MNKKKLHGSTKAMTENELRTLEKVQQGAMLSDKEKLLIRFLQFGFRIKEIFDLKKDDIEEPDNSISDKSNSYPIIKIKRRKSGKVARAFCPPETIESISQNPNNNTYLFESKELSSQRYVKNILEKIERHHDLKCTAAEIRASAYRRFMCDALYYCDQRLTPN